MAGDKRSDNHKYIANFHEKTHMIPKENLVELIGHEAGGVCPLLFYLSFLKLCSFFDIANILFCHFS